MTVLTLSDIKNWMPVLFVNILNYLQWILDLILDSIFGYSTLRGWKKERELNSTTFAYSAQMVLR